MRVSEAARAACVSTSADHRTVDCRHCERIQAAIDAEIADYKDQLTLVERSHDLRGHEIAQLVEALRSLTPTRKPLPEDSCHIAIVPMEDCGYCGRVIKAQALLSRYQEKKP